MKEASYCSCSTNADILYNFNRQTAQFIQEPCFQQFSNSFTTIQCQIDSCYQNTSALVAWLSIAIYKDFKSELECAVLFLFGFFSILSQKVLACCVTTVSALDVTFYIPKMHLKHFSIKWHNMAITIIYNPCYMPFDLVLCSEIKLLSDITVFPICRHLNLLFFFEVALR